ncbi:MAG: histidine phosphatase family protein [Tepidisphaeraceae bacterium]|jgi:probable phosphoglycerate mutase
MRVWFVRHGESEANVLNVFSNRGWKHPLTELGRKQTATLAETLSGLGVTAIYTSPVRRAVESADILSSRLEVPYEIEPALAEYDVGVYEGTTDPEGWKQHGEIARQWLAGNYDARMTEGESCNEIVARLGPFISGLVKRFGPRRDAVIVLVGHGGTYNAGLPRVLSNVSYSFALSHRLSNAGYAEALLRDGKLHCVRWGDATLE